MGVTSSAKRGEARRPVAPPSHLKREVIGVILIALSLLTLLSLLSFVPGEPKVVATPSATVTPPTHNLIGSAGAVFTQSLAWLTASTTIDAAFTALVAEA